MGIHTSLAGHKNAKTLINPLPANLGSRRCDHVHLGAILHSQIRSDEAALTLKCLATVLLRMNVSELIFGEEGGP